MVKSANTSDYLEDRLTRIEAKIDALTEVYGKALKDRAGRITTQENQIRTLRGRLIAKGEQLAVVIDPLSTPRDPKRIMGILIRLERVWKKHPDMRLGQLILNVASGRGYDMEDEDLLKLLETAKW